MYPTLPYSLQLPSRPITALSSPYFPGCRLFKPSSLRTRGAHLHSPPGSDLSFANLSSDNKWALTYLSGVINNEESLEEGVAEGALTNSPPEFFDHLVESTRKYAVTIRGIVP